MKRLWAVLGLIMVVSVAAAPTGQASTPAAASHAMTTKLTSGSSNAGQDTRDVVINTETTEVRGSLTRSDGTEIGGARIRIARRDWNTRQAFVFSGFVTTDRYGDYVFRQVPKRSTEYQISYAGSASTAPSSTHFSIRVERKLIEQFGHQPNALGYNPTLRVATSPVDAKGLTYLQSSSVGGLVWKTLGPQWMDRNGTVVYVLKYPANHVNTSYRVRVVGNHGFIDSYAGGIIIG